MYLHLGRDYIVQTQNIIGIFDIETTSVSARTRQFLRMAEKTGAVVALSDELPKSLIVTDFPVETVYVSPLSTATLKARCEKN